jgi:hypothetical protein
MPIHLTPADNLADALVRAREGDRHLILRGGAYYGVALTLTAEDSGLTLEAAPGETPVLYGGRRITGWQRDGAWWSAEVPEVRDGAWDFRHLLVNDRLCPRARLPRQGAFTHESTFGVRWMSTTGGGWERKPTEDELTTMRYRPGDLGTWLDLRNAELTIYHQWDESVVGIAALDPATRTVTFSTPAGHPPGAFGEWNPKARTYAVWNVRQGMTEPGQWYLDRTAGKIVYWPLPGEEMEAAEVIAPTTERVIRLEGTEDAPVTGVTLRGLTISATTTPLVAGGFAASRFDGALSGVQANGCAFDALTVRAVGGHGMKLVKSEGLRIDGCEVAETGAGGIYLHASTGCSITECQVHHDGRTYPSAIGVQLSGSGHRVSHNEIHHTTYSGIGCSAGGTLFESNLFYEVMQELSDGAAIYAGFCTGVVIRGNVVRGGKSTKLAHAYYIDEQGEGFLVEGNLAVNIPWPSHNHMARRNTIRNNVFLNDGDVHLTFMRCEHFTFERNIVIAGGRLLLSAPEHALAAMPNNILWSGTGKIELETLDAHGYSPTKSEPFTPRDGTVFADPRSDDTLAAQLGISPLDVSGAGRTSST